MADTPASTLLSTHYEMLPDNPQQSSLALLPAELLLTIAEFLHPDVRSLSRLSRTCHYLHQLSDPLLLGQRLLTAHLTPRTYIAVLTHSLDHGARANTREAPEPVTWDAWHYKTGCTNGRTLLHIVVTTGNLRAVELLLDHGARPNVRTESCCTETALHQAARSGSLKIVELLLSRGAHVDIPAGGTEVSPERYWGPGPTPLCLAVMNERLDIAKVLVDAGADVNICCTPWRCGRRAPLLHWAKSADMVEMLLDHGAEINATDRAGMSVLYRRIVEDGQQAGAVATAAAVMRVLVQRGGQCIPELRTF